MTDDNDEYAFPLPRPEAQPRLVRRDRRKGFTTANTHIASSKAAHLCENYTKDELLKRLASGNLVPGYSREELEQTCDWLIN